MSVTLSRCAVRVCFRDASPAELPCWCTGVQRYEPLQPVGDSGRAVGVQSGHPQPYSLCLYPRCSSKAVLFDDVGKVGKCLT